MKKYTYAWQKMSGAIDALIRPEPMRVRLKNACIWINDYNLKPEVYFPEYMRADFIHLRKEICKQLSEPISDDEAYKCAKLILNLYESFWMGERI